MAKVTPDELMRQKARNMADAELHRRYRAEYWALCAEYYEQLKAGSAVADG